MNEWNKVRTKGLCWPVQQINAVLGVSNTQKYSDYLFVETRNKLDPQVLSILCIFLSNLLPNIYSVYLLRFFTSSTRAINSMDVIGFTAHLSALDE